MKQTDVLIRTASHVDLLHEPLREALMDLVHKPNTNVPVYYQYLGDMKASLVEDKDNFIGNATQFHTRENGDIVCTVILNDVKVLAQNFTGVIDNFNVVIHGNERPKVVQFIVYDKVAKQLIDKKLEALPREGDAASPERIVTNRKVLEKMKEQEEAKMDEKNEQAIAVSCMEVAGAESMPITKVGPQYIKFDTDETDGSTNR